MSCRELERLFVDGAQESASRAHRAACATCAALGKDLDRAAGLTEGLRPAPWSVGLRQALYEIPRFTVSCEGADRLLAMAMEEETPPPPQDRERLESHLSRCGGCSQAAATLMAARGLAEPLPPPWLFQRVARARPQKKAPAWRRILAPRAVVAYAYGAAVVAMLAGFNPADLARRAGSGVEENTRTAVASVESSAADRFGALQEDALRFFAVVKGRAGGYGRAALSNAIALVMRTETRRPPTRPRNGEEGGVFQQNETQISQLLAGDLAVPRTRMRLSASRRKT